MEISIGKAHRSWRVRRFLAALFWALVWCGGGLAAIQVFYGPETAQAHPYLLGGFTAVFLVAAPVSLGFLLARLFGLFLWRGRLKKQIRRYLPPEEDRDPAALVEKDLKCRLFGVSEILLGRDWVVFPGGQAMKRDAVVGIYTTRLARSAIRITLVDEAGEQISYESPAKDAEAEADFLRAVHPDAARGDYREYTFFLRKEGENPDRRKLRTPAKASFLGVSRWDRNPILEENPVACGYERWLLASYAPYILADPYRHGDLDHAGGWERTTLQQRLARYVLDDPWEVKNKAQLLETAEHLVTTGEQLRDGWQLGRATMVLGFGYIAGYLTRRELLEYSLPAGEAIQRTFSGWEGLHESYLESYERWAKGYRKSRRMRREAYERLKREPGSILNTTPFDMNLRAGCREALAGLPQEAESVE